MSNRTLVELNHDYAPHYLDERLFGQAIAAYMRSGDKRDLPRGVTWKGMRHHSDPDPMKGKGDPS